MKAVSGPRNRHGAEESRWLAVPASVWIVLYLATFYAMTTQGGKARAAAVWEMAVEAVFPASGSGSDAAAGTAAMGQRIWLATVVLGLLLAATGWGNVLLRAGRVTERLGIFEQWLFSYGAGTALVSLSTLLAGAAGLMQRPLQVVLLLVGPAVAVLMHWRRRALRPKSAPRPSMVREGNQTAVESGGRCDLPTPSGQNRLADVVVGLVPALLLAGVMVAVAMLPPDGGHQYFDIKEYHLQAPKEYFLQKRITFLEHNVYASMPLGTEMLSLLAMIVTDDWWWGALVGQTLLATFAPATAGLLFVAGRRLFGSAAGTIAALLYLGTPAIFDVSTTAYVEGALCFYLFAALYAFCLARRASQSDGESTDGSGITRGTVGLLCLSGWLAGAAAACKYPAALYVVLPLSIACALGAAGRYRGISHVKTVTCFLAGALLVFGPWLARNTIDTGNPFYPLLWNVFGGRGWSAAQDARWWRVHGPPGFTGGQLVAGIWQVGVGDSARSPLNPLLFAFAPLALAAAEYRRHAVRFGAYVLFVLVAWWLATHRIERFWYPVIPLLALLAGAGGTWLARRVGGRIVAALVLVSVFVGAAQDVTGHPGWRLHGRRLFVLDLAGLRDRVADTFTKPQVAEMNRRLPADAVVLVVGEAAVFDFERTVFYSTAFNDRMLLRWLGARGAELARLGITHVYVDWAEIARYRSAGNYGFTDAIAPELFDKLVAAGVLGQPVKLGSYDLKSLPPQSRQVFSEWKELLVRPPGRDPRAVFYALYPVHNAQAAARATDVRTSEHR